MKNINPTLIIESAWEVCNQVGGIYTVIRSKVPSMMDKFGSKYIAVGPYKRKSASGEFEHKDLPDSPVGKAIKDMWDAGLDVHYGSWLISGRPSTILFNIESVSNNLYGIKNEIARKFNLDLSNVEELFDEVMLFGAMYDIFLNNLAKYVDSKNSNILLHFHEWMSVSHISNIKERNLPYKTIFTTHATILGRYLAMNDPGFYSNLPHYDWYKESSYFNILPQVTFERVAASSCDTLTTVSNITANECKYLLGREVDGILPNGLNIDRFVATHKIEALHTASKEKIHQFTMGHFFHNYSFDLKDTIYLFTSGRFEYKNKGYDLTLDAMAKLNYMLQKANSNKTVILFLITKKGTSSINPNVLESRGVMEELRKGVNSITDLLKERLFVAAASNANNPKMPDLNQFVDDYWKLRYRRTLNNWQSERLPPVTTHNLTDDSNDEILNFIRSSNMINRAEDRVKIVYHPDFINESNPLFGMEYHDFVRGCHMGVFPSYYEPWGYTPLESLASGVPAMTSNLAGFGDFIHNETPASTKDGVYIIDRVFKDFNQSAEQMAGSLFEFVNSKPHERIHQRSKSEEFANNFDWNKLIKYYLNAFDLTLKKN